MEVMDQLHTPATSLSGTPPVPMMIVFYLTLKRVRTYSSTGKSLARDGNRTKICRVKVTYLVMCGPGLGDSWMPRRVGDQKWPEESIYNLYIYVRCPTNKSTNTGAIQLLQRQS